MSLNIRTIEARIVELLHRLTLKQKVAQMVQADIRYATPNDVKTHHLGAILNGGGAFPGGNKHAAVADWVALADRYFGASLQSSDGAPAIPVLWGTDAVHGHNNVFGATVFPHNIGLGAAHDPDLVARIGAITAEEVAVTGIDWAFAPSRKILWHMTRFLPDTAGYAKRADSVYFPDICGRLLGTEQSGDDQWRHYRSIV